jgi:hypothetical protein
VGTTLLVTSSGPGAGAEARSGATRAGVRIAPAVGPGSVWLGASGRF